MDLIDGLRIPSEVKRFQVTMLVIRAQHVLHPVFRALSDYRGGVDSEGRPVMVVVGAHFLLRCLDFERFIIHVVKAHDA
ncbi:hypothetical protein RND71_008629 [Anisodus tanguticus]|uniref:Uncharacterized protein n=1 Tax=Anisodus tanguticus TaxID=243964 RepID=A0AAE1SNN1_9SOLA|nr:hypothetical protein RND71_008629 [Anisodus tanguticus]